MWERFWFLVLVSLVVESQALTCYLETISYSETTTPVVGISDQYAIVGFPESGGGKGMFKIFEYNYSWVEVFHYKSEEEGENLGAGVAISSRLDAALVGVPGSNGGQGKVLVYYRVSGQWEEVNTILGQENSRSFGSAVALALGSPKSKSNLATVVIGAPHTPSSTFGPNTGSVSIYTSQNTRPFDWTLSANFSGDTEGGLLGYSVAISNSASNVVAGAPGAGKVHAIVSRYYKYPPHWIDIIFDSGRPNSGYGLSVGTYGSTAEAGVQRWAQIGILTGLPQYSIAQLFSFTTFQRHGVDYNQSLPSPSTEKYFGAAVATDHNFPGGCILPVVGSPVQLRDQLPLIEPMNNDKKGEELNESSVYSFMYHNGYGNPWLLNTTLSSGVLPSACNASTFGATLAVSNGTAIIGSGGCVTFWCTGVRCG